MKNYTVSPSMRTNLENVVAKLEDALNAGGLSKAERHALHVDIGRGNKLLRSARGAVTDGFTLKRIKDFITANQTALAC